MRKVNVFIFLIAVNCVSSIAQNDSISLLQCLQATRSNAAIRSQISILSEIAELKKANAISTNLPSLNAYGKASYQSETMSITLPNMGTMEIEPFQYNVGLEANQKLYDGGISKTTRILEETNLKAETGKVEMELYQINNQTVQYFFTYLLLSRNQDVIRLKEKILNQRVNELQSAYNNGVISRNELDKLKTEVLVTGQQILDIEKMRLQSQSSLRILTGLDINENTKFYFPDSIVVAKRPEYNYFDAETERLQVMLNLKSKQNLPKLYAYGQLGYSYPGLNFFENSADYYYLVGAKLSWNLFDWNQVSRDKKVINQQKQIISTKKSDFEQKNILAIEKEIIEQQKLDELIILDETIIQQRILITTGSASALRNGTITSAAYMEDLNNEIRARIELETHKIQLMNSKMRSYLLQGIDMNQIENN